MPDKNKDLLQLLKAYSPSDPTEADFCQQMIQLLQSDGDPFSRHHFEPGHFTASAFILSPDEQSLLLVFHGKLHRWLQPGGHIDPEDQNTLAAAKREIREEVGISELMTKQELFDIDIHDIPALKQEPPHQHFDVRFLFQAKNEEFTAGSDAKDAKWHPLDKICEVESDRSVMRAVEKISLFLKK